MLAGQAGMEATGWLKVVGLVQKDVRSEMFAGWRREKSNNDRKVWRSVKNQAGREFAGCREMPGVTILPASTG